MLQQPESESGRLFVGAPESVSLAAQYVVGHGWCCSIGIRAQFQTWADAARGEYEYLTTEELVDVIAAALAAELLA
jgi:hypothetical protein